MGRESKVNPTKRHVEKAATPRKWISAGALNACGCVKTVLVRIGNSGTVVEMTLKEYEDSKGKRSE